MEKEINRLRPLHCGAMTNKRHQDPDRSRQRPRERATGAAELKQMSVHRENDGFNVTQRVSSQAGPFPPHAEQMRSKLRH